MDGAPCSRRGGQWYAVLGVLASASIDEVRRAFHELALLHHPDKSGTVEDDMFKKVQHAYEGLQVCAIKAASSKTSLQAKESSLVPAASSTGNDETAWPLSVAAPKVQMRRALDQWEHAYDIGETPTVPDDIPFASLDEMTGWILHGECISVDTREETEVRYERRAPLVPGAVPISFGDLRASPEKLAPSIGRLLTAGAAGKRVVAYSTHGGTSGNCGMCCAVLVDVFGLDPGCVWRLEGGFIEWARWAKGHKELVDRMAAKV